MKPFQAKDTGRIALFGIQIDPVTMNQAVDRLVSTLQAPQRNSLYVVTPNTDHIVMLQSNAKFRDAYLNAFLVVADGKPVVLASKLLGVPLPETVPGSDLVPALFTSLSTNHVRTKIYLFGAAPGVAEKASESIHAKWGETLQVVGVSAPDFGFEHNAPVSAIHAAEIGKSGADILVIGVGAPKQELWAYTHQDQLNVKLILCVGATIDFLAGEKKRSPIWMQRIGIEWFYRMCQEPKRLIRRYAKDAFVFPVVVLREALNRQEKK